MERAHANYAASGRNVAHRAGKQPSICSGAA
jgi:hypothetical protein